MKPEDLIKLLSEVQKDLLSLSNRIQEGRRGLQSDWKKYTGGKSLLVSLDENTEVLIEVENNGSFRIEFSVIA